MRESAGTGRTMFGALLIATLAASIAGAIALASGVGLLAALAVYSVTGSAMVAGWAGLVALADRRPRLRRARVALVRHAGLA